MEEREQKKHLRAHCLVLTYPTQGHINPLLQFSKRLEHKGVKVTFVTTRFISKTFFRRESSSTSFALEAISDGYDEGGSSQAESDMAYLDTYRKVGSQTLTGLIEKLKTSGSSVDCTVYDAFLPWVLDVAKQFGLVAAPLFTQASAVNSIYYHVHRGLIKLPVTEAQVLVPGMPPLERRDLPSFIDDLESYPGFHQIVMEQFSNIDKADWVLCNTFYELEQEVADFLAKLFPWKTIGPTLPSMYLDKQVKDDVGYSFNMFKPNNDAYMKWLDEKPKGSVAYISFGSLANLGIDQMEELCWGLKKGNTYFLWVLRESEEAKLPQNFVIDTKEKGLLVSWCSQLEVLAHEAVGCFITHCGWNSTLEALSLGVPLVAMPQWTDQPTNAKYVMDVWKMGLRVPVDEKGLVKQEGIMHCITEIMQGDKGREIKMNAEKWKKLAKDALKLGGSSDKSIDEFIANLALS
uniref:Glycosyltransferase n=1 Tax=Rhizophora mucronata TaxID=61149 RepID=A0A2P2Q5W8_RHIMU